MQGPACFCKYARQDCHCNSIVWKRSHFNKKWHYLSTTIWRSMWLHKHVHLIYTSRMHAFFVDEVTMMNRKFFGFLDRFLPSINYSNQPVGGNRLFWCSISGKYFQLSNKNQEVIKLSKICHTNFTYLWNTIPNVMQFRSQMVCNSVSKLETRVYSDNLQHNMDPIYINVKGLSCCAPMMSFKNAISNLLQVYQVSKKYVKVLADLWMKMKINSMI